MTNQEIEENQKILDAIYEEIMATVNDINLYNMELELSMHNEDYSIKIGFKQSLIESNWLTSLSDPELTDKLLRYIREYLNTQTVKNSVGESNDC